MSAASSLKSFSALQGGEGFRMRWVAPNVRCFAIAFVGTPHLTPALSPLKGGEGGTGNRRFAS